MCSLAMNSAQSYELNIRRMIHQGNPILYVFLAQIQYPLVDRGRRDRQCRPLRPPRPLPVAT